MDRQKCLKRPKQTDSETDILTTPIKSSEGIGTDFSDVCGSPDFLSSQECFSVGWDWSGQFQGGQKPTIRVIERPVPKRTAGVELLECSRPRRLIRNHNPDADLFDASVFAELKSLAGDFKRVPESTSPVASPPHSCFRRKRDILVTPTSSNEHSSKSSSSTTMSTFTSSSTLTPTFTSTEGTEASVSIFPTPPIKCDIVVESAKDNLNELLDDSLGADLLKFTQDLEQNIKQNESKTPKPLERVLINCTSAKRKGCLSLSSKKDNKLPKSVCRRINDVCESDSKLHPRKVASDVNVVSENRGKKQDKQNNNEFDDVDEATLLTLCEMKEQEIKSKEICSDKVKSGNSEYSSEKSTNEKKPTLEEEDDFVSPDLLDMIDLWEKKATQRRAEGSTKKEPAKVQVAKIQREEPSQLPESLHGCTKIKKLERLPDKFGEDKVVKKIIEQKQPPKKTLSLAGEKLRCTPEEIEKKRQDAIRKRLQLKKKL